APWVRALKEGMEAGPSWLQSVYPFLALIVGGLVAAGFAALIGIPVLRLKSDYLAIATLGFSEIIRAIFSSPQMDTITNGSYGLNKVPTFPKFFGLPSLFTPFIIAGVTIALMVLLINSSYGRAFKAIREDEVAAEAMGISLFRHKELSFVVSSFFTAISGGLLAMFMRSIEAKTFSIALTYDILLIRRHRRHRQRFGERALRLPRHREQGVVAALLRPAADDRRLAGAPLPHRLPHGHLLDPADGGRALLPQGHHGKQ
ncbi:MAG: branched-chain amino acid ABC transporter permease, partial [Anaerotruncus massiliensis (ex Togo et al. 2019)]